MTTSRPFQCVVAFDFSPSSDEALIAAVALAAREPDHVLQIMTALDAHGRSPLLPGHEAPNIAVADRIRALVEDKVQAVIAARRADVRYKVHVRIGKAATEILALAAEVGADAIFIGSHGTTGIERFLLGSVSERVVREAGCPVTVARVKTYADVPQAPDAFGDPEEARASKWPTV